MAGGEPRLGTTATYMRHNDHGTTRLSTEIDILHDLVNDEYRVFSVASVRKWSKFGLEGITMCHWSPQTAAHRFTSRPLRNCLKRGSEVGSALTSAFRSDVCK